MKIIINEENLEKGEIQEFKTKVRALLLDESNNVLIANYGNITLLPGGKVDEGESIESAILRELKEETGYDYKIEELSYLNEIEYFQKKYPKMDGKVLNRLIKIHYFVGKYKGIKNQSLTEKEKEGGFRLELVPIDKLEEFVLNYQSSNPRNIYFVKELFAVLKYYKKLHKK